MLPDTLFFETSNQLLNDAVLFRRIGRNELLLQPIISAGLPKSPTLENEAIVAAQDRCAHRPDCPKALMPFFWLGMNHIAINHVRSGYGYLGIPCRPSATCCLNTLASKHAARSQSPKAPDNPATLAHEAVRPTQAPDIVATPGLVRNQSSISSNVRGSSTPGVCLAFSMARQYRHFARASTGYPYMIIKGKFLWWSL